MSDWTEAQHLIDCPDTDFNTIRSLYISRIKKYDEKPLKQYLLCPIGIVGAGKSTVTIPLATKLQIPRVSSDEIRVMLKERGFNYNRAHEISNSIISELIKAGESVAIDANCGSPDSLKHIRALEKEYGVKAIWIKIAPPEEFIVNKLKNYKHTWLFKNGEEAVKGYYSYKEKFGDFSKIDVSFTYIFDTSTDDVPKQIDEAFIKIKDSALPRMFN